MLSGLPVWDQLVFRGATAIHGVYLHGRCSRDLDFVAPAAIKERFVEIMAEQGVTLQQKETGFAPFFSMSGTVFKEVAIGIDVCQPTTSDLTWVDADFCDINGVSIPVRVLPLPLQMAEKLRATTRRARSTDFYDFWLFMQKHPDLLPEVQSLLLSGTIEGEELSINDERVWEHFQQLRLLWHQDLIALMPQVPSFESVELQLSRILKP